MLIEKGWKAEHASLWHHCGECSHKFWSSSVCVASPLPATSMLTTRVLQHLEDLVDLQGATSINGLENLPEEARRKRGHWA